MSFQTVPINVTGPSYKDRSRPLSSQVTRNFYHELNDASTNQYTLKSFPGQLLFGSTAPGEDRGHDTVVGTPYRVVGTNLVEVQPGGSHLVVGTIPGTGRCIMANDGADLFIVTEQRDVYKYDGSAVTQVTDSNIDGSKSVTYFNRQFMYTKDTLSIVSDVGDGSTASGLNSIGADSSPDNLVRDYFFDDVIYRFGSDSLERWYNSGIGAPPVEKIQGQVFSIGLAAIHSITNSSNFIYWLGSDRRVYRARGGQEEAISSKGISHAIESYSTIDDAIADVIFIEGQTFYVLTFPTANKTWVVNEELGNDGWFEISAGTDGERYNANSLFGAYGKVLAGHQSNGNLLELSLDAFDLNGSVLQRRRVMASINGEKLGARGKRVQMSRFELILENGVGLISGQGEDPRIQVEFSTDGARSWQQGDWVRVGRLGETDVKVEWWELVSFYDLIIRITTTDPVAYNIYSGVIDIRLAGR
jgi:hypothetical protein